ncbi:polysaccharide biosynthesis protein [Gordonia sp. ABSL1-1]|uniref:lipopolysaccharide biosynthesis protein n=1 Tax=Gordonia sp. ABSL1-1 TaxID=3053923 RepID=UPI0025741169|nr:polysaccharide biosynthesis protein [Gordonia sp. ABSL1-1]MDL9937494.1 polysaccharide biosynthesis protein [Gordonia sp. ABSL1-1]
MTAPDNTDSDSLAGTLGRVTVATIIAAASGYLVLLIAARHLGASGYGVFAVFWAAYGIVTGAQNGQLQETTRAIRSAQDHRRDALGIDTPADRPVRINVAIGFVLAALVAVTAPLWSGSVFDEQRWLSVLLLAGGVASFAVYAHLCGALSGASRWSAFAVLLSVDALIRLVGAVMSAALGWGLTAFLVITVAGSASWCVLLLTSAAARTAVGLPGDANARRLTTNTLTAMAAALASAVLVMGFPVLIKVTAGSETFGHAADDDRLIGAVILAVTLTRAPLLVPLNSFQGVLISRFVDGRHAIGRALRGPLAVVATIGVLGSVAAWLIGPWLLTTIFGDDYDLDGAVVGLLTLGATTLGLLTVTGAATVAAGAHRWYATGWWVATIASALILLIPADVDTRSCAALVIGPLAGIAVHVAGLMRRT